MLPDLTPEEAVRELKLAGYDGVEWRVTSVPEEKRSEPPSFWGNNLCTLAPTQAEAERARTLAQEAGLAIPNLGTYIDVGDLEATENAMHFAQVAGAPQLRVGVGRLRTGSSYHDLFAEAKAFLFGGRSSGSPVRRQGAGGASPRHHLPQRGARPPARLALRPTVRSALSTTRATGRTKALRITASGSSCSAPTSPTSTSKMRRSSGPQGAGSGNPAGRLWRTAWSTFRCCSARYRPSTMTAGWSSRTLARSGLAARR